MGLFSKMINYVTGGSAEVNVEIPEPSIDRPFKVTVHASIGSNGFSMDKVYLMIRCQEIKHANYVDSDRPLTDNEKILMEMDEWIYTTIYHTEVEVTGAGELEAERSYSWEVEVDLSDAERKSFSSPSLKVVWELQAGIDVPGNDPDSGWQEFQIT